MVGLEAQEIFKGPICVKAHLEKIMDDDVRVRIWWEVESNSKRPVTILGYRIYFVTDGEVVSEEPKYFVNDAYILTMLRDGDVRTYHELSDDPMYYGISKPGIYHYMLQIAYSIEGDPHDKTTDWIESNKISFYPPVDIEVRRKVITELSKQLPKYLYERFVWSETPKCILGFKTAGKYIDLFCYTPSGEVCAVRVCDNATVKDLQRLSEIVEIVARKYAAKPDLVIGMLIARYIPKDIFERVVSDYPSVFVETYEKFGIEEVPQLISDLEMEYILKETEKANSKIVEAILSYIKRKERFYPSDIAFDLDIDYDLVCEVLNHLRELGIIGDVDERAV